MASQLLEEVVAIPKPVELQRLPGGHDSVDAAAVEFGGETPQLGGGKSEVGHGLIPPLDERDQFFERIDPMLEQQAAAAMVTAQLPETVRAENGALLTVLIVSRL